MLKINRDAKNIFDAISQGATNVIGNIGAIIANLISFIAFFAFVNAVSIWFFSLLNIEDFGFTVSVLADNKPLFKKSFVLWLI